MKKLSNWEILTKGIVRENPVLVLMIGLCPTLAVSTTARDGLGMGIAASFVLIASNIMISMMRKIIPNEVRIPIFIVVISTFVTIIDYLMQAGSPDLYRKLGVFVPLIVVNCIIMGRAEAFASKHSIFKSLLDGLGISLGFTLVITMIGVLRELLGNGTVFGQEILGSNFRQAPVTFMILPPGAFLLIGIFKGLINLYFDNKR